MKMGYCLFKLKILTISEKLAAEGRECKLEADLLPPLHDKQDEGEGKTGKSKRQMPTERWKDQEEACEYRSFRESRKNKKTNDKLLPRFNGSGHRAKGAEWGSEQGWLGGRIGGWRRKTSGKKKKNLSRQLD